MSLYFKRGKLPKDLVNRIINELVLNNGKEYMKFYKIDGDSIAVPYFYGKMIYMQWDMPFTDAIQHYVDTNPTLDPLNHKDTHTKVEIEGNYTLYENKIPILNKALASLKAHSTVMLNVATGFGKSIALIHLIRELGFLSLIFVTKTTFKDQLKSGLVEYTNAVVWTPGGAKKDRTPPAGMQVIICTPKCFSHIPQSVLDQIGVLAIDEAPTVCTAGCIDPLLSIRPRYIIACSATIKRRDEMHIMLDMLYGPSKVIRGLDIPVRLVKWLTGITVPYVKGSKGVDWSEHCKYICGNHDRNRMIVSLTKQILDAPNGGTGHISELFRKISTRPLHKIVMMTNLVDEHVHILQPMLTAVGITCDYVDARKKRYKDSQVLIGTSSKIGIGFDAALLATNYDGHPIDVVLQLVSTAQEELFEQELGRACRVKGYPAIFVSLIDRNNISSRHAKVADGFVTRLKDHKKYIYIGDPDEIDVPTPVTTSVDLFEKV
jgi:hypothetical protein